MAPRVTVCGSGWVYWPPCSCVFLLVSACSNATSNTQTATPTATGLSSTATPDPALTQDWAVYGFDTAHSGNNPYETTITKSTVGSLHRVWHIKLPDIADSAPI